MTEHDARLIPHATPEAKALLDAAALEWAVGDETVAAGIIGEALAAKDARIAELEAQLRDMPTIAYMAGAADQRDADRRANPKPPSP